MTFRRTRASPLLLCLLAQAVAAEPAKLVRFMQFAGEESVPAAVRTECQLQTLIPEKIKENAKDLVELTDEINPADAGRILTARIVEVIAQPGGKYSGKKSVKIEGELRENGAVIGSFTTKRERGSVRAWRGTCSIVRVSGEDAAEDIARWLKNPTMDARLGK